MIKTVGIVSLSSGMLGEEFLSRQLASGMERMKDLGLEVKFMTNALRGIEYLDRHPEKRAEDLIEAYSDSDVDMIFCAIGGDDTYRLLPYLFDNGEMEKAVNDTPFLGYSDTTINHFMLHKLGVKSFYGQAFIPDICTLEKDIYPYTKRYFEELITTGTISCITPSDIWYESREINGGFGEDQIGKALPSHKDRGFELLQGNSVFSGKILGGCIDSIYDMFDGGRYEDMPVLCRKYSLFPSADDWRGRILLLESSEEKPAPEKYRKALMYLKDAGVFDAVSGVLTGKPMDEAYDTEYRQMLREVIDDKPVVCNINTGHAAPHCIVPFGREAVVDAGKQEIRFI